MEKSFSKAKNHGLKATEVGATGGFIETFDYNSDGQVDIIYSNERGKWHLLKNQSPDARNNKFVIVKVGRSPESFGTQQGAELTLSACGKTYVRKVGATSAAFLPRYEYRASRGGSGQCALVDAANVKWINGETQSASIASLNTIVPTGQ